jgi:predicted RecA/RadA family phage recombinase
MALSADTPRVYELGDVNELTVAATVTIYEGAFVFALKADGTAVVASPALSTHAFAGIAIQGATAGNRVRIKDRGKVVMAVTGASAASVGAIVYASDDNTLTLTASTNVSVGYVSRHITSTTCLVEFRATAERDTAVA